MTTSRDDDAPAIDPRYAAGQLVVSLRAAAGHVEPALRAKAETRAKGWLAVIANLASGALKVGERKPFADTPVWVTPEVLRGGFASGAHAAGGALLPHETALVTEHGVEGRDPRGALNGLHLTPTGLASLASALDARTYRVRVPEEGALLVVRWLIERGENESAASLVETLSPWFDRLRFYPQPGTPLAIPDAGLDAPVLRKSAHELATSLRRKVPSRDVEVMREANEVWAPLTDAMVSLVLETVDGEAPRLERGVDRRTTVVGGTPFTRVPSRFDERSAALLDRIARARDAHRLCRRPHRAGEVFETLREGLAEARARGVVVVSESIARRVRTRLAGFLSAYGVPGSPEHTRLRESQRVAPSHALVGQVVAQRLEHAAEPGDGLDDPTRIATRVLASEASRAVPEGASVPASIARRLDVVREAPLPVLIEHGLVGSGEILATLLPQVTGPALASRFDDVRARTLYAATYGAFRKRRSLLLLWLQHQVRFAELPWVAALESTSDRDPTPAVRASLRDLAALALTTFPETITPNKLVSELASLAAQAGLAGEPGRPALPLVEEVASDIFMGTFSIKFLRAAEIAARLLGSTSLYARYYGLDFERVLAMDAIEERWGVKTCPTFDAYCMELAALPEGGNPRARAGAMIEEASILTTHNLAALVSVLDLEPLLHDRWLDLAKRALVSALDRLENRVLRERVAKIQRMRAAKTLAFSWRQMLFFLSRVSAHDAARFAGDAHARLADRSELARERFAPVLRGLDIVAAGGRLTRETEGTRRLYGWSTERPFLMG